MLGIADGPLHELRRARQSEGEGGGGAGRVTPRRARNPLLRRGQGEGSRRIRAGGLRFRNDEDLPPWKISIMSR